MPDQILTLFHRKILRIFAAMEESRAFYFTGAMALSAYHLHHRLSEDIDIFCPEANLIPIVSRKVDMNALKAFLKQQAVALLQRRLQS